MIPKIIHYCWFGPKEKSELEYKCIESWKKAMPDYKIIEWTNRHLFIGNIPYIQDALKAEKYAFVSDVFRVFALYRIGGIYLDTDTEVFKSFDEFLDLDFFCGFENWNGMINPAMSPLACAKQNPIIGELFESYIHDTFPLENPDSAISINERFKRFIKYQYNLDGNFDGTKPLALDEKSKIFPYNYFINYEKDISYALHHYRASWSKALAPKVKKIFSVFGLSLYSYQKVNKMSDEFIWPLEEKVVAKFKINEEKYLVFAKK